MTAQPLELEPIGNVEKGELKAYVDEYPEGYVYGHAAVAAHIAARLQALRDALDKGKNSCRTCSSRKSTDHYPCHSCSIDDKRCKQNLWEPMDWFAEALAALDAPIGD